MEINEVVVSIEARLFAERDALEAVLRKQQLSDSQFGPLAESCKKELEQILVYATHDSNEEKFQLFANVLVPEKFIDCCTPWGLWNGWVDFESKFIGLDRLVQKRREQDKEREYLAKMRKAAKALEGVKLESFGPKLVKLVAGGRFDEALNLYEQHQKEPGLLPEVGPPHSFENLRISINNIHHLSQSLGVALFLVSYSTYPEVDLRKKRKRILEFLWSHLVWTLDYHMVFLFSPRHREMLPASTVNWLHKPVGIHARSCVLDLFGNLSLLSYFAAWLGAKKCVINDVSILHKTSILTEIRKKLLEVYLEEGKPKNHRDAEKVLKDLGPERYCGYRPFLPVDALFIKPRDAWTFGGLVGEIERRGIVSELQIEISPDTKPECFGSDPFDLVVVDPPFGLASSYQVTEQEGEELAKKGISLARHLLRRGGSMLFRKRCEWTEMNPEDEGFTAAFKPIDNGQTVVGIWKR